MHERVPRTFYFIVSSPNGLAEAQFHINFTHKRNVISNAVNGDEELLNPEEIHFPVFGSSYTPHYTPHYLQSTHFKLVIATVIIVNILYGIVF